MIGITITFIWTRVNTTHGYAVRCVQRSSCFLRMHIPTAVMVTAVLAVITTPVMTHPCAIIIPPITPGPDAPTTSIVLIAANALAPV